MKLIVQEGIVSTVIALSCNKLLLDYPTESDDRPAEVGELQVGLAAEERRRHPRQEVVVQVHRLQLPRRHERRRLHVAQAIPAREGSQSNVLSMSMSGRVKTFIKLTCS